MCLSLAQLDYRFTYNLNIADKLHISKEFDF